jgi:histone H3/H4
MDTNFVILGQIYSYLQSDLPHNNHLPDFQITPTNPSRIQANTPPTATVQKIVTEILPSSAGLAFGKDARDLLIECCVEFITLISSEANEISEKESKKTIACEHITKALEQLGFGEYVSDILTVAGEHKEQLKVCLPLNLLPPLTLALNRKSRRRVGNGLYANVDAGTRKEGE